jgi:hypothetical protein
MTIPHHSLLVTFLAAFENSVALYQVVDRANGRLSTKVDT